MLNFLLSGSPEQAKRRLNRALNGAASSSLESSVEVAKKRKAPAPAPAQYAQDGAEADSEGKISFTDVDYY